MIHPRFGHRQFGEYTVIDELIDEVGTIPNIDAKILLMESYETAYGIYDHENADFNRPLALVALHPKETYWKESGLYRRLERYNLHEVNQHFGLSLTEFLALPRDYVEDIFDILRQKAERETPDLERQKKALTSMIPR